jgi:predicted O-methyltransferase YrrM
MKLNQTPQEIIDFVAEKYPEIEQLIFNAHIVCHKYKGSVQPYQAAVLYYLAKDYNHCNILEVGTGVGYSTYFLVNACPNGLITTVNPVLPEMDIAEKTLWQYNNILYERNTSKYFFNNSDGVSFDFIFIDADHKDIKFDVKWFDRLNDNGTIVFHDYSNSESKSPCLPVWNELTTLTHSYGDFDIEVVDSVNKFGMAGWIKK